MPAVYFSKFWIMPSLGNGFSPSSDTIPKSIYKLLKILNLKKLFLHVSKSQYFFFNSDCSNLLYLRNLQEQVKKAFFYQKLFWPFTVWMNCSSDLKNFANSRPSASNFKKLSRSLDQFFLTVGQNNFDNKIPFLFVYIT